MKNLFKILIIVVSLGSAANALGFGKRGGDKGPGRMGKILKQLDLSSEQKEKLKSHRETQGNNKKALKQKMKDLREKMKNAFNSSASDSELRSIHSEMKGLKSQMADARFEKMLFIRSILTPDQRVKLQELKEQKRKGKRRGRGHHSNDALSE